MSNKELRKELKTCREAVAELKEEITDCKLEKVRRQNQDLQLRLSALEKRDPTAIAKRVFRRRQLKMKDDDPPGRRPSRVPPGRPAQNQFRSSRPPARKPVRMQRNQTRSRQEAERAQVRATAASNRQSPDYIRRNRRRLDQRRYGKSFDPGYEQDARGLGDYERRAQNNYNTLRF